LKIDFAAGAGKLANARESLSLTDSTQWNMFSRHGIRCGWLAVLQKRNSESVRLLGRQVETDCGPWEAV
jgi:hypothetical protein